MPKEERCAQDQMLAVLTDVEADAVSASHSSMCVPLDPTTLPYGGGAPCLEPPELPVICCREESSRSMACRIEVGKPA